MSTRDELALNPYTGDLLLILLIGPAGAHATRDRPYEPKGVWVFV
jgi:hypothetical protein